MLHAMSRSPSRRSRSLSSRSAAHALSTSSRCAFIPHDDAATRAVWLDYARWLVAALTFQLAADIVATSFAPTWDDVGRLAVVAAIRTFLSYFLEREMAGADRKLQPVTRRLTRGPAPDRTEPHGATAQRHPSHLQSRSDRISVELSSRRTGMSFQRTRMSADRTLMSVIRTSLSLISFGFTIFQVFQKANDTQLLKSSQRGTPSARRSCCSASRCSCSGSSIT